MRYVKPNRHLAGSSLFGMSAHFALRELTSIVVKIAKLRITNLNTRTTADRKRKFQEPLFCHGAKRNFKYVLLQTRAFVLQRIEHTRACWIDEDTPTRAPPASKLGETTRRGNSLRISLRISYLRRSTDQKIDEKATNAQVRRQATTLCTRGRVNTHALTLPVGPSCVKFKNPRERDSLTVAHRALDRLERGSFYDAHQQ